MACVAYGCKSRSSRIAYAQKDKNLSFHRFPVDNSLRAVWVTALQRKNWKPSKYSRLCSKHFEPKCYLDGMKRNVLCRDAVPTIFESCPTYLQKVVASIDAKTQMQYSDKEKENTSTITECRACLQVLNKDSVLYNIFEEWTPSWDGMGKNIAKDLAKLANVQILETDAHSKIICATCCQLLISACNFTALVKNNDQILRLRHLGDSKELDSLNDRVWPKPIQVDKSITTAMYENLVHVEIKQEIVSEDEYPTTNGTYDTFKEKIPNLDMVKVESEEMIPEQPLQLPVIVNGSLGKGILHNDVSHMTNGINYSGDDCSKELESMILIQKQNTSDGDDQVTNNKQEVNDQNAGDSTMVKMCPKSLLSKTQCIDSNQRLDNKAAECSRLYRERHREIINQRRIIRQSKKTSKEIEQINETSYNQLKSKSHIQRQQTYYETHKEDLNKRKRDKRLQQKIRQSISASAAERNRKYRERKRQMINEKKKQASCIEFKSDYR